MSDHAVASTQAHDLRTRAMTRLRGSATGQRGVDGPADALAVLHALASSPTTAVDALALLHELQVHQVELELQAQELRESRLELEAALRRQIALHDAQPVGCFLLDRQLVISDLNPAGARLLGVDRDAARGVALSAFFAAGDMDRLQTLAAMAPNAAPGAPGAAASLAGQALVGPQRWLQAHLGSDPAGGGYLLVLTEMDADARRP